MLRHPPCSDLRRVRSLSAIASGPPAGALAPTTTAPRGVAPARLLSMPSSGSTCAAGSQHYLKESQGGHVVLTIFDSPKAAGRRLKRERSSPRPPATPTPLAAQHPVALGAVSKSAARLASTMHMASVARSETSAAMVPAASEPRVAPESSLVIVPQVSQTAASPGGAGALAGD